MHRSDYDGSRGEMASIKQKNTECHPPLTKHWAIDIPDQGSSVTAGVSKLVALDLRSCR